jgi:hypothetical protein
MVIAGMHRSGTSLITQWLNRCGLNVGEKLLGKGIGNDDGHYEDLEFYQFHLNLLKDHHLPESGFIEDSISGMTEKEKIAASNLINRKNQAAAEWGWKDPRTCLLLSDYHELIPDAHYLVVFRDFRSTVASLIFRTQKVIDSRVEKIKKKSFFERLFRKRIQRKEIEDLCTEHAESFLKVWMLYNQEILNFIDTIPEDKFLVLNYESLINSDQETINFIREDWEFSLSYVPFLSVFKPAMISKELNFERFVDQDLYKKARGIELMLSKKAVAKRNLAQISKAPANI